MGADGRVSEKNQTRAVHIYRVTLILWLPWFARTSTGTQSTNRRANEGSARTRGGHCTEAENNRTNTGSNTGKERTKIRSMEIKANIRRNERLTGTLNEMGWENKKVKTQNVEQEGKRK